MKFYIAHMTITSDYVKKYIEPKIKEVAETINPFDYEHWRENYKIFLAGECEDVMALAKETVNRDLTYINHCDGTIAYIQQPSIGTSMEIIYSKLHGKLVFLIIPEKELQNHPWFLTFSNKVFHNVEDLVEHIKSISL